MAEDPPETPNYGFPLMSQASDDYVDLWHLILEDGSDQTNNDGLIVPLDTILNSIEADLANHENATSAHGSNGDVAGMNDLYTDAEARSAIEAGDVNHVKLADIEDVADGEIGRDNSIGFLGAWGGNTQAVLWDAHNVQAGSNISVSGGVGGESNPQIDVSPQGESSGLDADTVRGTVPKNIAAQAPGELTEYSASGESMSSITIADITASGVMSSGFCMVDGAGYQVDITWDGNTLTFNSPYSQYFAGSDSYDYNFILPPVEFDSSLKVEIYTTDTRSDNLYGTVWVHNR